MLYKNLICAVKFKSIIFQTLYITQLHFRIQNLTKSRNPNRYVLINEEKDQILHIISCNIFASKVNIKITLKLSPRMHGINKFE